MSETKSMPSSFPHKRKKLHSLSEVHSIEHMVISVQTLHMLSQVKPLLNYLTSVGNNNIFM